MFGDQRVKSFSRRLGAMSTVGILVAAFLFVGPSQVALQKAYATEYILSDEASCLALPSGSPSWDGSTNSCEINGTLTISSDDRVSIYGETSMVKHLR